MGRIAQLSVEEKVVDGSDSPIISRGKSEWRWGVVMASALNLHTWFDGAVCVKFTDNASVILDNYHAVYTLASGNGDVLSAYGSRVAVRRERDRSVRIQFSSSWGYRSDINLTIGEREWDQFGELLMVEARKLAKSQKI